MPVTSWPLGKGQSLRAERTAPALGDLSRFCQWSVVSGFIRVIRVIRGSDANGPRRATLFLNR